MGWDCAYYLKHIKDENFFVNYSDPLYFMISGLMYKAIGNEILVVKSLLILIPLILSIGMFMLVKKVSNELYGLLAVILINLNTGVNRIWTDMYKNLLAFSMIPFLLYYVLDEEEKSTWIATAILFLMLISHLTSLIFIPILIFYSILTNRKIIYLKIIKIISIATILYILAIIIFPNIFGIGIFADYFLTEHLERSMTVRVMEEYVNRADYLNNFSSAMAIYSFLAIMLLFSKKRDMNMNLFLSAFIILIAFSLLPLGIISGRVILFTGLISILIIITLLHKHIKATMDIKLNGNHYKLDLKPAFIIVSVIVILISGLFYMNGAEQIMTDKENDILHEFGERDDILLLLPSRFSYFLEYFELKADYKIIHWEKIQGIHEPDEISKIFTENNQTSYQILTNLSKDYTDIYILFNFSRDYANMNETLLEDKLFLIPDRSEKNMYLLRFEENQTRDLKMYPSWKINCR